MNKILVLAVHPDDETLGAGGTLLKHKANGDEVYWLIATTIDKTHSNYEKRQAEITQVSQEYGFNGVYSLDIPTMRVDEFSMGELVGKISKIFNEVQPNIVYLPFKNDVHSDHRKIFEAAYSCTKSFRYPFIKKILMMEVLSETEFAPNCPSESFAPNVFMDITPFFEKKVEIMRLYASELGKHPSPRSEENLKALATLRGATAGCEYAESFMLLKELQ